MMVSRKNFFKQAALGAGGLLAMPAIILGRTCDNPSTGPCHLGKRRIIDRKTGRGIWQMTDGRCHSWRPYQYSQAFTQDEKYFVFSSDRTGINQLYRMDIESGESTQLTWFSDYVDRPLMSPTGNDVFYRATGRTRIWATDVPTGLARQIADLGSITDQIRGVNVSGDGSKLAVIYDRKDNGIPALAIVDVNSGAYEHVWDFVYHSIRGEINNVGHIQFCPTNNKLLSCILLPDHQGGYPAGRESLPGPDEFRARAWTIDLVAGELKPIVVTPAGHRATHEYWSPDGTGIYFHQKTVPGFVPTSIEFVKVGETKSRTIISSDTIRMGHSAASNDNKKIVSDCQLNGPNELILIDIATGNYEILCWPNTSGTAQMNHVHPNFSPSGRYILYTTDTSGYSQCYLIDLHETA